MRVLTLVTFLAVAVIVALLPTSLLVGDSPRAQGHFNSCQPTIASTAVACPDSEPPEGTADRPLPAGDAPAFLFAAVQPIKAPEPWRGIYHEVERCAGMVGDYDVIHWAVMDAPLQGPKGPTYGFNVGSRIVLVRQDTTYLRHEMLHHILQVAGWQPRPLQPGERYSIADLHPMPIFTLCTGGGRAAA
jgi:hypothetical protein